MGKIISRTTYYSALEYPTLKALETMLWDNTKGDHPAKITRVKNQYIYKVIWKYD